LTTELYNVISIENLQCAISLTAYLSEIFCDQLYTLVPSWNFRPPGVLVITYPGISFRTQSGINFILGVLYLHQIVVTRWLVVRFG